MSFECLSSTWPLSCDWLMFKRFCRKQGNYFAKRTYTDRINMYWVPLQKCTFSQTFIGMEEYTRSAHLSDYTRKRSESRGTLRKSWHKRYVDWRNKGTCSCRQPERDSFLASSERKEINKRIQVHETLHQWYLASPLKISVCSSLTTKKEPVFQFIVALISLDLLMVAVNTRERL